MDLRTSVLMSFHVSYCIRLFLGLSIVKVRDPNLISKTCYMVMGDLNTSAIFLNDLYYMDLARSFIIVVFLISLCNEVL